MAKINKQILEEVGRMAGALLVMYEEEIDLAYLKAEKGVTIPLSVKINPGELASDNVNLAVSMSFNPNKIKDEINKDFDPNQGELFGGDVKKEE